MKKPPLVRVMDKVVALHMKVLDKLIEDLIEPVADVGNPEQLIGKPYETWTPQELQQLIQIYGTQEPNPLSDLVFKKTYERVKEMEEET